MAMSGACACRDRVFEAAQHRKCNALGRANDAGALAMRALRRRAFEHARSEALPRHFHQPEMRDAAKLDAGAVKAQRVFQTALDGTIVPLFLHVDEIDHDEAGEVAQLQLSGDFVGRLEVR